MTEQRSINHQTEPGQLATCDMMVLINESTE